MSDYRIGDVVIFGRKQGEKTLGTVVKVNQKTVKIRQDEQRGTMKSHALGTVWKVPFSLARHATEAEAARLQNRDAAKAAPGKSQVPPRKNSARTPVRRNKGITFAALAKLIEDMTDDEKAGEALIGPDHRVLITE